MSSRSAELIPAKLGGLGVAFSASSCLCRQSLYFPTPCDKRSDAQVSSTASLSDFFKPERSGSLVFNGCVAAAPGADVPAGFVLPAAGVALPAAVEALGAVVNVLGSTPLSGDAPGFAIAPFAAICAGSTGVITKTGMSAVLPSRRSLEKRLGVGGGLGRGVVCAAV